VCFAKYLRLEIAIARAIVQSVAHSLDITDPSFFTVENLKKNIKARMEKIIQPESLAALDIPMGTFSRRTLEDTLKHIARANPRNQTPRTHQEKTRRKKTRTPMPKPNRHRNTRPKTASNLLLQILGRIRRTPSQHSRNTNTNRSNNIRNQPTRKPKHTNWQTHLPLQKLPHIPTPIQDNRKPNETTKQNKTQIPPTKNKKPAKNNNLTLMCKTSVFSQNQAKEGTHSKSYNDHA
jgi:hypothetical protein